ncbi:MAG TPA: deoxyribodipyrimidine photo-lyase [Solirubrobacteraceae bacterium]|nr:deoxyribodipyrimidine photo-lyase [Solirubrobacteraceae bacterium]
MSTKRGAMVLFTRDLRIRDNQALTAAIREFDEVIPLFVLDQQLLAGSCGSPNRLAFLLESLRDLDSSLRERGARLIVRRGDVVEEAMKLVAQCGLTAIHMSADFTPYAQQRHRRLEAACEQSRVQLCLHPGVTVIAPGKITPGAGDHYRVFTPYWRVWSTLDPSPALQAPRRIAMARVAHPGTLPALRSLVDGTPSPQRHHGGESAGRAQLERWLRHAGDYEALHDDLPADGTSHLSPHLHFGCLSPRTVLTRAERSRAAGGFARQLCWRDFHHQVLAAHPELPSSDYRPRGDRWRRDKHSTEAWKAGMTGYPIVDAGMRQLALEGFMHNRARLIVSSFLTKTLYIDWRTGAAHFARLLIDADVANNVGNWQWVAGTGNDTRPNRVLNPIRQAHRFDPQGKYVRHYVPELAGVKGRAVHEPWKLGAARRALGYPWPLVDHEAGAAEFRAQREGPPLHSPNA